MPFKSDKQRKYLYANNPEVAREFSNKGKASGGMLKRAIANTVRMPDLSRLRSGGMVGTGSRMPAKCVSNQQLAMKKFKEH